MPPPSSRHGAQAAGESQHIGDARDPGRAADALFSQSESSEYFHAESPAAIKRAEILNEERFLSLDLNFGRRVNSEMYEFLTDYGMTRAEYRFFLHVVVVAHHTMVAHIAFQ